MEILINNRVILIPDGELKFTAMRSRGPGGQNVNEVSSAAQLQWDFRNSTGLTDTEKRLIDRKLENHVNSNGLLYLRSDEFRDLPQNKSQCLVKLERFIKKALHRPKPRKKTKPTKSSQIKRVDSKKQRGLIKESRSKVKY